MARSRLVTRRTAVVGLTSFAAALTAPHVVRAQAAWPSRPLTLMHGFGAGGNADVVGRLIADRLTQRLGQQVVVDPRPGAGGTVAAGMLSRANPDGYTIGIIPGGHAVAAAIYRKLPYQPVDGFSMVSMLTDFPFVLATHASHPVKSVADLIERGKREVLTCASPGNGTGQHLAFELFASMAKIKMQHVPYRGSPQAAADLVAQRIDFWMDTPTAVLSLIKDGKLRAVATTGTERFFALPDVPYAAEAGMPDYSVTSWLGVAGPPGLPAPIVERLNKDIHASLAEPATAERLRGLGSMTRPTTPDEFRKRITDDIAKWTKVVDQAKIERV